jgi:hypothetical protein
MRARRAAAIVRFMPTDAKRDDPLVENVDDLDDVVREGQSEKTPFILLGRVYIVTAAAVAVILALAVLAYYLA